MSVADMEFCPRFVDGDDLRPFLEKLIRYSCDRYVGRTVLDGRDAALMTARDSIRRLEIRGVWDAAGVPRFSTSAGLLPLDVVSEEGGNVLLGDPALRRAVRAENGGES